jgi:aspartate/methionine/tyrosine aminotransferase
MSFIAQRLDRISPSQTIAVRQKVAAMKREGRDVLGVSSGEPDFGTPRHVKDAAIRAIEAGETKYTDVAGTPELRRAVADRFRIDCGIDYRADEIIIGTGAKQVLFNAMLATLDDGDEAIIPTPCWVSYPDIVSVAGGRPVFVPCSQNHAFRLHAEDLEAAITPRTRWFILNNPCNPTGVAYSAADLRPLCNVLLRHPDVWVMTDDIYAKLAFEEKPATIVQVEPRLKERTVTLSGCSKSYAMTGWRIGFAGAPAPLVKAMDKLQSRGTGGADRTGGFHHRHGGRVPRAARHAGGDAERSTRHHVPQTGSHVLRVSLDCRLSRPNDARRRAHHRRPGIRHGTAGRGGRGRGARHGVHVPRPFPDELRRRHRGAARGVPAHPALLS